MRPTWAEVDLDAIADNVRSLVKLVRPAAVCAVVKADGYGHGALESARAALAGGASWLAVALVEEAVALRDGGLVNQPLLVLSEPPPTAADVMVGYDLDATVYSASFVDALAVAAHRVGSTARVHLKVDTGMHRVGAAPADVVALARRVRDASPALELVATCTHLAVADDPHDAYTAHQLDVLDRALASLWAAGIDPGVVHAANSAGAIAHPRARHDMVRCGIAIYGLAPDLGFDARSITGGAVALEPAMRLVSSVGLVRTLPAGERLSYGLRYRLERDSVIATVPIGYADGVPRRLSAVGGEVLIGGRRRPIAGRVTMDQLLVNCGPPQSADAPVAVGDEVVLLGRQGPDVITAWEWAGALDTIAYEITCGVSARVPRRHLGAPSFGVGV